MNLYRCWLLAGFAMGGIFVTPASACGLHPTIGGGLEPSYPGALDIAVAVAEARQEGVLPRVTTNTLTVEDRFRRILADLERLQSQLEAAHHHSTSSSAVEFSLVLIGPGLWSYYKLTPAGVQARYHVHGPVPGKAVVLTHPLVLRALLDGGLTVEQAAEFGLIAYSSSDTGPVREALETGFRSNS